MKKLLAALLLAFTGAAIAQTSIPATSVGPMDANSMLCNDQNQPAFGHDCPMGVAPPFSNFSIWTNPANGTNWKNFGATAQYNDVGDPPIGTWSLMALNDNDSNPALTDSRNSNAPLYGCNQLFLWDTWGAQAVPPQLPTDFNYFQIGGGSCGYDGANIDMFPADASTPGSKSGLDITADVINLSNFYGTGPAIVEFNNQPFITDSTNHNWGFLGGAGGLTGTDDSGFGNLSLYNCTSCSSNSAYGGNETLFNLIDGARNTAFNGALGNLVHGSDNTALSYGALGVAVGSGSTAAGSTVLGFYIGPGHVSAFGYALGQECHTGDYILLWGVDDTTSCGTGSGYGESNVIHVGVGFGDIWSATGTNVPGTSASKVAGTLATGGSTIGALPTCNSGLIGAASYVTNAQTTPAYLGTVSATGAVTAPVFCNGSAWIYH